MTSVVRIGRAFNRLGVGRSQGYEGVDAGILPRPFKVGARAAGLLDSEVDAIIAARAGGATDIEMRHLVDRLHQQRLESAAAVLCEQPREVRGQRRRREG